MVKERERVLERRGGVAVNRGAWTAEEDQRLVDYVRDHGDRNWRIIPAKAGLNRCGKSCRLRWLNYLRPGIKRGNITEDEEDLIIRLHNLLGNRWSLIAGRLPGRTDNEVKNHWNTHLSKRALTIKDLNEKLTRRGLEQTDDEDHSNDAGSDPTTASVRSRSAGTAEEEDVDPSLIPSWAAAPNAEPSWLPPQEESTPRQQDDHNHLHHQQRQVLEQQQLEQQQQQQLLLQHLLLQQQHAALDYMASCVNEEYSTVLNGLPLPPEPFGADFSWQYHPSTSFTASCQQQQGVPKILLGQQLQQQHQQQQFYYPASVSLNDLTLTGMLDDFRDYYLHHP